MRKRERHGMHKSPEYKAWEKMKARCSDKTMKRYGGRGISVCDEWEVSFVRFYADVGPRPSKEHSIERINNNLGYSPDNCKWATREEQANNTCRNVMISAHGKTQSLSKWSRELKVHINTLWNRIYRSKIDPELAFTKDKFSTRRKYLPHKTT